MTTQPENIFIRRTRELREAWLSGEFDHSEARDLLDRETPKVITELSGTDGGQTTSPVTSFSPSLDQHQPNLRRVYDQLNGRQR